MRISDWSSDVCSSDLDLGCADRNSAALYVVHSLSMRWLLAKIGLLAGTTCAAAAGAAASQTIAFVHAYLQRLGGHIDEATRTLAALRSGEMGASIRDPAARDRLIDAFAVRLGELETARDAILDAGVFLQPIAFLTTMDREIAHRTSVVERKSVAVSVYLGGARTITK